MALAEGGAAAADSQDGLFPGFVADDGLGYALIRTEQNEGGSIAGLIPSFGQEFLSLRPCILSEAATKTSF